MLAMLAILAMPRGETMPQPETPEPGSQNMTAGVAVQGATPQRPVMTPEEKREEIERAAGVATPLRELRDGLPAARSRRTDPRASSRRGADRVRGVGAPRSRAVDDEVGALSAAERELIIDQAILMLDDLYAHLPLKRALHAIDPVQRLRLLRLRHHALDEREFQSEMIDIFNGLRDLHTNYVLPEAYWPKFAFLPFRVEEYYQGETRKYLVSAVSPLNTDPHLVPGVEITHWSGMPIDLAVARNAAREAGSNPEARRARGLEALTLRWLGMSLPPEEDWIVLTYTDGTETRESRIEWRVIERQDLAGLSASDADVPIARASALAVDIKTELLRRVRKALFDAPALRVANEMARARRQGDATAAADLSVMPDVFPRFGAVTTPSGVFGYVRVATFAPSDGDIDGAVEEFVRILRTLPSAGLILDVRGNGGGYVPFGERILQTLCAKPITPEPFHFVTTEFTLRVAEAEGWLSEWVRSLGMAIATGAGFSQGFPLTSPAECNNIGQVYQGPVVLVTDAFCYSTTDIFAAGYQDHSIGLILGCHDNTGAGGANVWDYELLQQLSVAPNPFVVDLPGGAGMRVAARRSTRVGELAGVPLEDLGVVPDERHFMTRADLLDHNVDLIAHAARLLAAQPSQTLTVEAIGSSPLTQLRVTSTNIDRVDVLADGRPVQSTDVTSSPLTVRLPNPVSAGQLVVRGYRRNALVVSARVQGA
jgi:hypothetical protein